MSRKAELTMELVSAIEAETKKAHWPNRVARRLGVHPNTYSAWMKRGEQAHQEDTGQEIRDPEYLYRQLYERIEEAEAYAEMMLLDSARGAAEQGRTTWNGYMVTLERRFSDRWRRRDPAMAELADTFEGRVKAFMLAQQALKEPGEKPKLRQVE